MSKVPELFGSMVFDDSVMRTKLPKISYKEFRRTIEAGEPLSLELANVIASAIRTGRWKKASPISPTGSSR